MAKFLIIRFSSIGDIVLTTPVIRCLKNQVKLAEVHFLTKKGFAGILQNNPYIDTLHLLDNDLEGVIKQLKEEHFDYIIDLHHNLRTLKVKLALGVKSFSFDKLNIEKWAMTALKINLLPKIHIVDRYLSTLKAFGVKNDGKGLDYFIPDRDRVALSALPPKHEAGYIGIVIGAALATKQVPIEKLDALISQISVPIVLLGGPGDAHKAEELEAKHPQVYNACGKFNLNQSADLVRQAKLIISPDTGLMHIAAAFSRPIFSIWGNTIPGFGMGPYYPAGSDAPFQVFEVANLSCRPCSKIGYKKCPKKHFRCMMGHDTSRIAEESIFFFTK